MKLMTPTHSDVMKQNWLDPEFRKKQRLAASEAMRKRWGDPVLKVRQAQAISNGKILATRQITETVSIDTEPVLLSIMTLLEDRPDLKERLVSILKSR